MYKADTLAPVPYVAPDNVNVLRALAEGMQCWIVVSRSGTVWVHGPRADEVVAEWGKRGN